MKMKNIKIKNFWLLQNNLASHVLRIYISQSQSQWLFMTRNHENGKRIPYIKFKLNLNQKWEWCTVHGSATCTFSGWMAPLRPSDEFKWGAEWGRIASFSPVFSFFLHSPSVQFEWSSFNIWRKLLKFNSLMFCYLYLSFSKNFPTWGKLLFCLLKFSFCLSFYSNWNAHTTHRLISNCPYFRAIIHIIFVFLINVSCSHTLSKKTQHKDEQSLVCLTKSLGTDCRRAEATGMSCRRLAVKIVHDLGGWGHQWND